MLSRGLVLLFVVLSGCRFVTKISDSPCASDADCELISAAPPACCSRCRPVAATKSSAESARKACEGAGADCPQLSCVCEHTSAVCRSGRCEVDVQPCR